MKHWFRFVRLGLAAGCLAAFGLPATTAMAAGVHPTSVGASTNHADKIVVTWSGGSGTFDLRYSKKNDFANAHNYYNVSGGTAELSREILEQSGIHSFTPCYFWVEARNAGDFNTNRYAIGWLNPGIPGTFSLNEIAYGGDDNNQVILGWAASTNASYYEVHRSTNSASGFSRIATVTNTTCEYRFNRAAVLAPGVEHYFKVRAVNPAGGRFSGNVRSTYILPQLGLSPKSQTVSGDGGTGSVNVTSDAAWTTRLRPFWVIPTTSSGTGNGTLTFRTEENPSSSARTGTVSVVAAPDTPHPRTATFTVVQRGGTTLPNALDWTDLSYSSSGSQTWVRVTSPSHDGVDAAKSGSIGGGKDSRLQATVAGPCLARYWWMVSSEPTHDKLAFAVDGTTRETISGTNGTWMLRKALLGPGSHTLSWTYSKDATVNKGRDAGFVDQFAILDYPKRTGYHTTNPVPLGTPGVPLGHDAYFAPNGEHGSSWVQRSDGTWVGTVRGSDGSPEILQSILNEADDGDTIVVGPGCYDAFRVTNHNVRIVSSGGRGRTFINAKYGRRCVDFSGTTGSVLSGFTLVQGRADEGGGIRGGAAEDCAVWGCEATGNGGGAWGAKLTDCRLEGNTAGGRGGGAFGGTLTRCEVRSNGAGGTGGGIAEATAVGCLVARNEARQAAGADKSTLMSCTVTDNQADATHGGVWRCTVKNGIVVGNAAPAAANWGTGDKASTFAYTCADPKPAGTGNFFAAPNFVNWAEGNYHLNNYSKCRDKGNKNLTKAPYDLAGLDRVMGSNIDVGCYEYATGVTPLDAADYDGDGVPDIGFYNPKTTTWFVRSTADGTVWRTKLGVDGGIIVSRDWDGDGIRDPAVYDPNTGKWLVSQSGLDGTVATKQLGWKGITVVDAADVDGDGKADPIIFNPKSKTWQALRSGDGGTTVVKDFGWSGIKPVCGDYDGDGKAELAFYSPTSGKWYVRRQDGTQGTVTLGVEGARVCPIDADFDGTLDPCYFNPADGKWTWQSFVTGKTGTVKFGDSTVTPHPFDWDGDGMPDTMGMYSPYRAGFLDHFPETDGSRKAYMINF